LLPPPLTAPITRTRSQAPDRWLDRGLDVDLLTEPVERPVVRYLHKYDDHYDRIVPDFELQYRTAEQQYLYQGDFSLLVREYTDKGAIVQDAVTGIFGFVPEDEFLGDVRPEVGSVVPGARCTYMDQTRFESSAVDVMRSQTGVVWEWDRRTGEGYILPTEGQDAWQMRRVLRRDILWHGSRQLYAGQWVMFETARAHEVPIEPNDEPEAAFALQVKGPEVRFSFKASYPHVAPSSRTFEEQPDVVSGPTLEPSRQLLGSAAEPGALAEATRAELPFRMPAESGLKQPLALSQAHPALQRFAELAPAVAKAESPPWLWEAPMLDYLEDYQWENDPIVPYQFRGPREMKKWRQISTHEHAVAIGKYWDEPRALRAENAWRKMMPPSQKQAWQDSVAARDKRFRAQIRRQRLLKIRAAKATKERY